FNNSGLFDHVIVNNTGVQSFGDVNTNGHTNWAAPTGLGTANFLYWEDSVFAGKAEGVGGSIDCSHGGKWASRFNTYSQGSALTHPTRGTDTRGCRAFELYANSFNGGTGIGQAFNVFYIDSGTGVVWGNNANNSVKYSNFITLISQRHLYPCHYCFAGT